MALAEALFFIVQGFDSYLDWLSEIKKSPIYSLEGIFFIDAWSSKASWREIPCWSCLLNRLVNSLNLFMTIHIFYGQISAFFQLLFLNSFAKDPFRCKVIEKWGGYKCQLFALL